MKLIEIREKMNLSVEDLSEKTEVEVDTIEMIESGNAKGTSFESAMRLSQFFSETIDEFKDKQLMLNGVQSLIEYRLLKLAEVQSSLENLGSGIFYAQLDMSPENVHNNLHLLADVIDQAVNEIYTFLFDQNTIS